MSVPGMDTGNPFDEIKPKQAAALAGAVDVAWTEERCAGCGRPAFKRAAGRSYLFRFSSDGPAICSARCAETRELEICPRCQKPSPNVGPWSGEGEGGHLRLCGGCKFEITMADPARRQRLEDDIRAIGEAMADDPPGSGISELLAPFTARGRRGRRS